MLAIVVQASASLALGAFLWRLIEPRDGRSPARRAVTLALCLLLAAQAMSWCWALRAAAPGEISAAPLPAESSARLALAALLGAAAYAAAARELVLEGVAAGVLLGLLGAHAVLCLRVLQAWEAMGWFAGWFLPPFVPVLLGLLGAAAAYALRAPELAGRRWQAILLLLLAWAGPPRLAFWRLRTAYGLGAPSLSADARLPPAGRAERVSVAWLFPAQGKPVRFEERRAVAEGVEVSPESLERLKTYLEERGLRGVFVRQALAALRRGWLFWWEPDRALDAAALHVPGRPPDYKTALGLLRGGPMDEDRYRRLEELAAVAEPRKEGFEDVNTSQLIFEGFASAYARFGDESSARKWLLLVDNLWPIYEKRIEVSPLETAHDCRVDGSVLVDGRPSPTVKVGLFYVAASTATAAETGTLSQSAYPDGAGRFSFGSLAPGTYYLGLMGLPSELRGTVVNSPGFIEPAPERPIVRLDPIRVER